MLSWNGQKSVTKHYMNKKAVICYCLVTTELLFFISEFDVFISTASLSPLSCFQLQLFSLRSVWSNSSKQKEQVVANTEINKWLQHYCHPYKQVKDRSREDAICLVSSRFLLKKNGSRCFLVCPTDKKISGNNAVLPCTQPGCVDGSWASEAGLIVRVYGNMDTLKYHHFSFHTDVLHHHVDFFINN